MASPPQPMVATVSNRAYLDKDRATREANDHDDRYSHASASPQRGQPERVGVLLVNLGTPDTADAKGVRVYLKEFLSDPRVIEDQGLVWKLVAERHHPAIPARAARRATTRKSGTPRRTNRR